MLEWNVIIEDFNRKEFVPYNIFNHSRFGRDVKEELDKVNWDKDKMRDIVQRELRYYFWSKCEYEVILSPWPPNDFNNHTKKIDVFWQVDMNLDRFCEYLLNHREEL